MAQEKKPFPIAPPGPQRIVCVDYERLGKKPVRYKKGTQYLDRIAVYFLSEYTDRESGKNISIRQEFNEFMGKGRWRTFLEDWRGTPMTEAQAKAFDPEKLIGVNAQAVMVHNATPGRTFANIDSIGPAPAGEKLEIPSWFVRKRDRAPREETVNAPDYDSDVPF